MADSAAITEKQPLLESQQQQAQQHQEEGEEPSLAELQQEVFMAQRRYMRAWSRTTSGKWHKRIMLSVTGLLCLFIILSFGVLLQDTISDDGYDGPSYYSKRVPLEAHIMSKCPDAQQCLHDAVLPAMQDVSHLVDFKLSYIGHASPKDDEVTCMHGQEECLGNIIELCAAHLYPVKQSLGFTMCLTRQYEDIPRRSLVEDCALEHGISMEELNACSAKEDGSLAVGMLRDSFNRSAVAGVTKSCTIRVDEEVWCIVDGGEWKECQGGHKAKDLVKTVEKLYYNGTEW